MFISKMLKFVTNYVVFNPMNFSNTLKNMYPIVSYHMYCHFSSTSTNVAIFWDLNNKPSKSISVLDAAICVKKASFSFGVVRFMAALGYRNTLRKVSSNVQKVSTKVGKFGLSFCRICGRRFWSSERLGRHFRDVHEAEQRRRVRKVEFARGGRRVRLVGKFSMKMRRYDDVVRGFGDGSVGGCLLDDLRKVGFWVKGVSDTCDVVRELRDCVLNVVDVRRVECVVIVCDDSGFVSVLKELKLRGVKVVVVGDGRDGDLKRIADAAFSWQEIISGKVRKEVVSVVRGWKDRDVLKRLEWSYNPDIEETQ